MIDEKTVSRYLWKMKLWVQVGNIFYLICKTIYHGPWIVCVTRTDPSSFWLQIFRCCVSPPCRWIWFGWYVWRTTKLHIFIRRTSRMWWKQNYLCINRKLFSTKLVSQTSAVGLNWVRLEIIQCLVRLLLQSNPVLKTRLSQNQLILLDPQ